MNAFYNLKTAYKLALGFGLCLALAVITAAVSLSRMAQLNQLTRTLNADAVVSLGDLTDFSGPMRQFRITEYRAVLNNNPKTFVKDQARLAAALAE